MTMRLTVSRVTSFAAPSASLPDTQPSHIGRVNGQLAWARQGKSEATAAAPVEHLGISSLKELFRKDNVKHLQILTF